MTNTLNPLERLTAMLRYRRPAGSYSEQQYIQRFIAPLPTASQDAYRNWHVRVGQDPLILWSSHTDTVHRTPGEQNIALNPVTGYIKLAGRSRKTSNCLGADDTVGNWLMVEMIARGVPGHYIFHYGEERGGVGSSDLARYRSDWLKQFTFAIALDRRGTDDIITHQGGGKTASKAFANSLADVLNSAGPSWFSYAPSAHGIYTDTAEYGDIIPECTNVSVGYYGEHWKDEYIDTEHTLPLLDALCAVRAENLIAEREPGDDGWTGNRGYTFHSWDDADTKLPGWYREDYDIEIDMNDAPPLSTHDVEGVYLSKEFADVQRHFVKQLSTTPRRLCSTHGFHDGTLCPKCAPIKVVWPKHNAKAEKHAVSCVCVPCCAAREAVLKRLRTKPNSVLTPSKALGIVDLVERARRRQRLKIRKRTPKVKGAWSMSPTIVEKGEQ